MDFIKSVTGKINLGNLKGQFSSFNFGAESLFGILFVVALLLWGLSLGRTKIMGSILSAYVSFALAKIFPFSNLLEGQIKFINSQWLLVIIFIIFYGLVFFIFNSSFINKRFSSAEFSLAGIMILSVLNIGILSSMILAFLPMEMGIKIAGGFYNLIGSNPALFIWSVLPFGALFFGKSLMK